MRTRKPVQVQDDEKDMDEDEEEKRLLPISLGCIRLVRHASLRKK